MKDTPATVRISRTQTLVAGRILLAGLNWDMGKLETDKERLV